MIYFDTKIFIFYILILYISSFSSVLLCWKKHIKPSLKKNIFAFKQTLAYNNKKMNYLKLVLGISLLIGQIFAESMSSSGLMDGKVYINLYYESKCPDSQRFINNQIDRALEKFPGLINFSFVPYGFVNVRASTCLFFSRIF